MAAPTLDIMAATLRMADAGAREGAPLDARVDVAVIGGGVVGLAVVHHLRRLAPTASVALVEPAQPGRLTSAVSTGGYRNFYPADPNLTQLAHRSIQHLERIAQESGNGDAARTERARTPHGG